MRLKVAAGVAFLGLGLATVVLAVDRRPQTQGAAVVTYAYKIDRVRGSKDLKELEQRLNDAGRTGWRVLKVVSPSFNDELVVVLEKPETPRQPNPLP